MAVWIGLFRGINVGGNNKLPMKDLTRHMTEAGMSDVKTYIASGNVVFRSEMAEGRLIETIESLVETHFGFHAQFFLITLAHLEKLMAENPFKDHELKGKAQHLFFLKAPASKVDRDLMDSLKADNEAWHLTDECFYFYAPDGIGQSKLMEKLGRCLKADMTARNLNTVETLRDMAAALAR